MREIMEHEAVAMAGEAECPVLRKQESEAMEAALCLKRFPDGYVLGASDRAHDLKLWFTTDLAVAREHYDELARTMAATGSPFGGRSVGRPEVM